MNFHLQAFIFMMSFTVGYLNITEVITVYFKAFT